MMAIVASVLFVAAVDVPRDSLVAPAFETHVSVAPSSHDTIQLLKRATPYTYTCTAVIADPDPSPVPHNAYGSIKLVVEPGGSETKTARVSRGFDLTFTTKIDAKRERAEWTLTIEREGKVVSRQTSTVWLQPVSRNVPAQ